jgi:hypothetical protein
VKLQSKFILAGDLNAKHPFWNSAVAVSNISDQKCLQLFDVNNCEISAPQYSTSYSAARNRDVLDTVVQNNIGLSLSLIAWTQIVYQLYYA